jgi:hypothetical protein
MITKHNKRTNDRNRGGTNAVRLGVAAGCIMMDQNWYIYIREEMELLLIINNKVASILKKKM